VDWIRKQGECGDLRTVLVVFACNGDANVTNGARAHEVLRSCVGHEHLAFIELLSRG
jgi:hypothetical protein